MKFICIMLMAVFFDLKLINNEMVILQRMRPSQTSAAGGQDPRRNRFTRLAFYMSSGGFLSDCTLVLWGYPVRLSIGLPRIRRAFVVLI